MPGTAFAGAATMITLIALGVSMSGGGAAQTSKAGIKRLLGTEMYLECKI